MQPHLISRSSIIKRNPIASVFYVLLAVTIILPLPGPCLTLAFGTGTFSVRFLLQLTRLSSLSPRPNAAANLLLFFAVLEGAEEEVAVEVDRMEEEVEESRGWAGVGLKCNAPGDGAGAECMEATIFASASTFRFRSSILVWSSA